MLSGPPLRISLGEKYKNKKGIQHIDNADNNFWNTVEKGLVPLGMDQCLLTDATQSSKNEATTVTFLSSRKTRSCLVFCVVVLFLFF